MRSRMFACGVFTLISALGLAACADAGDDSFDDHRTTEQELIDLFSANAANGPILASGSRIRLAGAPARQLYNLMIGGGASESFRDGFRFLRGNRTQCASNGVDTRCSLTSRIDADPGTGFAVTFDGASNTSAARYVHRLLRTSTGTNNATQAAPWFTCVRDGATWCGIEEPAAIDLEFSGLPALGENFVYEGWAVDDSPVTTDRFTATDAVTQYIPASLNASVFVLTIEPRRNDPAAPADTHILAGAFDGDASAALSIGHGAAIGTTFGTAAASYVLATPTTAATDDNNLGIWFVGPSALDLPTLPAGWTYEGWIVGSSGPVSTGRFLTGNGPDSDGAGPTAGPLPGPPAPGQDFITPPVDLIGETVVISVEPEPDDSPLPFELKPLVDATVEPIAAPGRQSLANMSGARPSGTATLR